MVALVALLLAVGHPPAAAVSTPAGRVPLAITSWCWDSRCGAPLGHLDRRAVVQRGSTVHLRVGVDALEANASVGGARLRLHMAGRDLTWAASRSGGLTVYVKYRRGWVIYTGRLTVR